MLEYLVVFVPHERSAQLDAWQQTYNVSRPHRTLHNCTPLEFANNHAEKNMIEEVKPATELALQLA